MKRKTNIPDVIDLTEPGGRALAEEALNASNKKGGINHTRVDYKGHRFDSIAEYERYKELKIMSAAGEIYCLIVHPCFELIPKHGKEKAMKYTADFQYWDEKRQKWIVEDVKSEGTRHKRGYRITRRLFIDRYGDQYTFKEVVK